MIPEDAGRFIVGRYHLPLFYRYVVAFPGFRMGRNHYGDATIGAYVVVGRWAYCVKWGVAKWVDA